MIAFPPSTLVMAACAFVGVSLKIGWDFYRAYQKNMEDKKLAALDTKPVRAHEDAKSNESQIDSLRSKWARWQAKHAEITNSVSFENNTHDCFDLSRLIKPEALDDRKASVEESKDSLDTMILQSLDDTEPTRLSLF